MIDRILVHYWVDDGTSSGYKGVNQITVTRMNTSLVIGRAPESKYISAVRVDRESDTVRLLKESPSDGFYTEAHELNRIERIK